MEQREKRNKRVLVTGGAGFIGSQLCQRLLAEGAEVYCLDNLLSGSMRNIRPFMDQPSFHFVRQDVEQHIDLNVDEIYHLACPASPVHYQKDPVRTARTNFFGAQSVLDLARRTGARVLLSSTSEIYGEPLEHPQTESYRGNVNPDGIRACYDEGKRIAETLFFDYHRQYGVSIGVVRIFNTYGPNMDPLDGRVVSNFINQALAGEDLTVYGDGSQTRCFCYVDDMVEALMRVMARKNFTGPVNLGNPQEISMITLADTVLRLCGTGSRLVYGPLPSDDPTRRRPDISLARRELDWEPQVNLEEGLARTIRYYQSLLAANEEPDGPSEARYRIGLVMGAFDLFHVGHLRLIQRARARCGWLRVGVLSDELVQRFKGSAPVISQKDRMEILRALREVDEVVAINDTPDRLTEWRRRPFDCFFSGDDHRNNEYWIWEQKELKKIGVDMVYFPYTEQESSSSIRSRVREN